MSLEQTQRLAELDAMRDEYHYRGPSLRDKVLVALIGPTATGKSTLINEILVQCNQRGIDAGETATITTRERRAGSDPAQYVTATEGTTHASMIDQIERGLLTNWSVFPTGDIYGGTRDSLPGEYNFSPLIPDSLPMLRRAGFRALHAIYIAVPPDQWARQLPDRANDPKFARRIDEAVSSLEYARNHSDELHVISNVENEIQATATRIIDLITSGTSIGNEDAFPILDDLYEYAHTLQKELHGDA